MYKILLVDDEIWMCEGLKKVIHQHCPGFIVDTAAKDGIQALKALESRDFDLIITDIRMPGMDGIALLKEIRHRGLSIPVIIISGHSEFEYAKMAIRYDVLDYILKPLDREEIVFVLEKCKKNLQESGDSLEEERSLEAEDIRHGSQLVEFLKEKAIRSYMDDLSISVIADEAGFNLSYLSRLFKLETGKGFVQFLTEVRMDAAKRKLLESNATIADIAKQVGYWDEKHFSKVFKREIGRSPSEFRRESGECK
jgi:two-component system response regulator YesN